MTDEQRCRVCGCTDSRACDGGCTWVKPGLCSRCVGLEPPTDVADGGTGHRMPVEEFRRLGYLQEVNRRLLHPLGLALEVTRSPDGFETLSGIWDYRHDPEGMIFADGELDGDKAAYVENELRGRAHTRTGRLGYVVQPV